MQPVYAKVQKNRIASLPFLPVTVLQSYSEVGLPTVFNVDC